MVCELTANERERLQREAQLKALERQLKERSARIAKVGNRISIEGWNERGGWCDACALRALKNSADIRVRQMAAEALGVRNAVFGHGH